MRLIVVSHPEWHSADTLQSTDSIVLPASVPALVSLQRTGATIVKTSDLLRSNDYHETWDEALKTVWGHVTRSWSESHVGPNLTAIHAYSTFLLLAQIGALHRFFEQCHARFELTEVWTEPASAFSDDGSLSFPSILFSSYYHRVAAVWAQSSGMCLRTIEPTIALPPVARRRNRSLPRLGPKRIKRALARVAGQLGGLGSVATTLVRMSSGLREVVAYTPYGSSGLYPTAPSYALNLAPMLAWVRWRSRTTSSPAHREPIDRFTAIVSQLTGSLEPYRALVHERATQYVGASYPEGAATFHAISKWLRRQQERGATVGYVSAAAFIDFGNGYVADAFRQLGLPVAGIQHGGNARISHREGAPVLLIDALGGLFFQWGNGSADEHAAADISHACRFVTTGSPRMRELQRGRKVRRSRHPGRPRILYAPTLVSVGTSAANNLVWFDYIPVVQAIAESLNASGHECFIKVLPTPESRALDWSRYPNVMVLWDGGFGDYMWDADYLMVDALGGSPAYEALATDKPILLYTDGPQQWDERFMMALRRRAMVFEGGKAYVDGVRQFLTAPARFVAASGTTADDDVVNTYMPPVTDRQLWHTIHETMFSRDNVAG